MKHRILFVDDEPLVLQGLQRMLRSMREEWEMTFAEGGVQALDAMAQRTFDVVVTDMRMPNMNGAQLLTEVMHRYPTTVRLVLSGHADKELVTQCLGVAHQYISKPCDAEQMKAMVRNACLLGGSKVTNQIKEMLGSIDRLPSLPSAYLQLEQALAREGASSKDLGDIIQQDMAMTAKILKIVNSSFFGLRRTISSPQEAVNYLGTDTVKVLVLANSIFERADPLPTTLLTLEDLWHHTIAVAQATKAIAKASTGNPEFCEQAFVGAILEDVGVLVLAAHFPESYDRVVSMVLAENIQIPTAELWEFGITHTEIGTYLLGLWGLPAPILRIVGRHHQSSLVREADLSEEQVVYSADVLVGEIGGHPFFRTAQFSPSELPQPGWDDRLETWRTLVKAMDMSLFGAL